MPTKSLFDTESIWLSSPSEAFSALVLNPGFAVDQSGQPRHLRDSSVRVYLSRWNRYDRWLATTPHNLATISTLDLEPFFATITTPASRYRYYQLLERVFDHLIRLNLRVDNPARALAVRAPSRSEDGHLGTQLLTQAHQAALLAALPPPTHWKKSRDRALLSLILGAGLTVNEVIHQSSNNVGQVESDGTLPIEVFPPSGALGRRHRTRVQAFATHEVTAWLERRAGLKYEGNLLFPAALNSLRPLNSSSIYRLVSRVLDKAGLSNVVRRKGPRSLRSTFAVNSIEAGASVAALGESMGFHVDRSARRYKTLARRAQRINELPALADQQQ